MCYICLRKRHLHVFDNKIDQELLDWSKELFRNPLLLRGARQVGKSSAVKELSKQFDNFLEVNFEEQRQILAVSY